MNKLEGRGTGVKAWVPLIAATALSAALYVQSVLLLLSKVGEVLYGVFDTSVPAYPVIGLVFVGAFLLFRKAEFERVLAETGRDMTLTVAGLALALVPGLVLLIPGTPLAGSYSYAGIALACGWVGFAVAFRTTLFPLLYPYLLLYLVAIGLVGLMTNALGDPLALAVAGISEGVNRLLGMPVGWSSVNISFTAAGGAPVNLFISRECSGIASMSVLLLMIALIHLDLRPPIRTTLKFAILGSVLFLILNSLRVVGLIAGGLYGGVDLMWSLHGWLGYALYVVGYSAIMLGYVRSKRIH